ncbi:NUDIX hydrolase [Cellulomonas carbonis]|uniref:DNA mismatch repair protein MutT n=1 Tax=Cellulomonas carbonis T26 TaxID=947969 RepID=A0A0A0BWK8_9CELL|nr:NUDIX hydrolase [Cellulomonas carbonis]KGM11564.1 DNA mismatch repair protein MutT [Cellulomonas carbonis T26]GGC06703.1 hypothetical protein GCM10010972_19930 [Cellulomonas carbonis]
MELRVASYAVVVREGQLLLSRFVLHGEPRWTMPGGGLDPGETPQQAAVREVEEETGYVVELDALIGTDAVVVPAERRPVDVPLHAVRIVFRAHVVGGELRHEVGGSTDRAEWFPLAAVADLPRQGLVDVALGHAGLL